MGNFASFTTMARLLIPFETVFSSFGRVRHGIRRPTGNLVWQSASVSSRAMEESSKRKRGKKLFRFPLNKLISALLNEKYLVYVEDDSRDRRAS